jgi:hypothetical protein
MPERRLFRRSGFSIFVDSIAVQIAAARAGSLPSNRLARWCGVCLDAATMLDRSTKRTVLA